MNDATLIYELPAPYTISGMIQIYGWPENAVYEWRIVYGEQSHDTGTEGGHAFRGRQYGSAEIALRDALMTASGMKDGYTIEAEERAMANATA